MESETWDVVVGNSVRGTLTETRGTRAYQPIIKGYTATILKTGETAEFKTVEDAYYWIEEHTTRRRG